MKKAISYMLALLILTTMLAGCTTVEKGKQTSQPEQSSSIEAKGDSGQKEDPSWKWDNSSVEITWFVAIESLKGSWDVEKNIHCKMITDLTGIKLNISTGPEAKLNALIASNSLPDVVTMPLALPAWKLLENQGSVLPLEEMIEKYAPTFDAPKSMQDWYKNKDGHWYTFISFFTAPELMTKDNYFDTHNLMMARTEIMQTLGIKAEDFQTQDGTVAALTKVKDSGITYKGLKVEPFYLGTGVPSDDVDRMAEYFGVEMEDKEGNYLDTRKQPRTLEALKFINRLYREEIITDENLTLSREQIAQKIQSGAVFAFSNWGRLNQAMRALLREDESVGATAIGPIKAKDGVNPHIKAVTSLGYTGTLITKGAKNPDRIIRFFEYMYSEDAQFNASYGPKGTTWEMGDDGIIKLKDEYFEAKKVPGLWEEKYNANFAHFVNYLPIQLQTVKMGPPSRADGEVDAINQYYGRTYAFDARAFSNMDPDAGTDQSVKALKIKEYWSQQVARMWIAKSEADVERVYNETLKHMDELGWQEVYNVMNVKFKENKVKMGVESAMPANLR